MCYGVGGQFDAGPALGAPWRLCKRGAKPGVAEGLGAEPLGSPTPSRVLCPVLGGISPGITLPAGRGKGRGKYSPGAGSTVSCRFLPFIILPRKQPGPNLPAAGAEPPASDPSAAGGQRHWGLCLDGGVPTSLHRPSLGSAGTSSGQ